MIFIPYHDPPEIVEPGEEAFHLPSSPVSPERPPILCLGPFPPALMRRDHFDAQAGQRLVQAIAVIGLVADEPFGQPEEKTAPEGSLDQFHFMRRSTFHVSGDRKTRSVCNGHDLRAFAPLRLAHSGAPFFAGAKVPSIKASRMPMPPRSRRYSAKAKRISSKAPARTHSGTDDGTSGMAGISPAGLSRAPPSLKSTGCRLIPPVDREVADLCLWVDVWEMESTTLAASIVRL